jgi:cobalt-zinc-cadmium efflux system protein
MGADHSHAHQPAPGAPRATSARYKRRLLGAFAITAVFAVVQIVAAVLTESLALLSDAGHMFTDVIGLGMALAAMHLADRGSDRDHRTFGLYRVEILAALANAVLLFGVALYVLIEAVRRLSEPAEVLAGPMLVVAVLGLVANIAAFALLRGAEDNLNMHGAYLEVLSDLIGSIGVIVAAVVLQTTGWEWVDPVVAVAIGVFILPRAYRLGARAVRILIQAAPEGLDLEDLQRSLGELPGVVDVHDVHVWTLTSEMVVASAHLMVVTGTDTHGVLDRARDRLSTEYGIHHATLQVEPDTHEGCEDVAW